MERRNTLFSILDDVLSLFHRTSFQRKQGQAKARLDTVLVSDAVAPTLQN